MRSLLVVAGFCTWAACASAEDVRVLSGEHENFSRLVMVFAEETSWDAKRTDDGYAITLGRQGISLGLDQVFDLIPRDRLQSISFDKTTGALNLTVECTCYIKPFEIPNNTLVIDIVTGTADPNSPFEVVADPKPREDQTLPLTNDVIGVTTSPTQIQPSIRVPTTPAIEISPLFKSNESITVDTLETALIEQLGRASSQGLITLQIPAADPNLQSSGEEAGAIPDNLASQTVFDQVRERLRANARGNNQKNCQLASELALTDRGGDMTAAELLAEQRALLGDLVGQPSRDQKTDMAIIYLYLGFGAEARFLLQALSSEQHPSIAQINTLSHIVDEGIAPSDRIFQGLSNCNNASALWAVLSGSGDLNSSEINTNAVQASFFALPDHLKQQIAPSLMGRLSEIGLTEIAAAIQNSVTRSAETIAPAVKQAVAEQELQMGQEQQAERRLKALVAENTETTPQALLTLMTLRNDQGAPVPAKTRTLAEAIIYEQRGQEIASKLSAALALAKAIGNDFEGAFSTLDATNSDIMILQEARQDVIAKLVKNAEDERFLTSFFSEQITNGERPLREKTIPDLAERLLNLGFAKDASSLVGTPDRDAPATDKLLWARIQLELGKPREALATLAGEESEDAKIIRANAMAAIGRYQDAIQGYVSAGEQNKAAQLAWFVGIQSDIEKLGTDAQREFVALPSETKAEDNIPGSGDFSLQDNGDPAAASITLTPVTREQGRNLVTQSRALRQAADALLAEEPLAPPPG
ncbi:hypothetical protein [Actibacterium sp. 188UL27-1]|uniref:hypothetical protein n=1 Tax=Actibacterium sp. 188UL27-1 TaxID=2786961 RepID=UPI00195CC333|nr:hypothetical protein [Actibacterium sp. 188UL27-1]MBM7066217.1 hypothetical protein [Actibacterium sp. 188UL27-1]